jgi:hypothetical protein
MTWNAFHHRGEILRSVLATADRRRDGVLPMDVIPTDADGRPTTFSDELDLLSALTLRWHTRLAGHIERNLMDQPLDLPAAIVAAWHDTADELPGVRAIIDAAAEHPADEATARAMSISATKEQQLLAVMAGLASQRDQAAARVGAELVERARSTWVPPELADEIRELGLLHRIRALMAA